MVGWRGEGEIKPGRRMNVHTSPLPGQCRDAQQDTGQEQQAQLRGGRRHDGAVFVVDAESSGKAGECVVCSSWNRGG